MPGESIVEYVNAVRIQNYIILFFVLLSILYGMYLGWKDYQKDLASEHSTGGPDE